ncbi:MAG: SRPBCC domain-containing protein [Propionibacteriales bacterium]|nr:SRPBCC domain-containing protein [Propionibacteriales bacterium]
MTKEFEVRWEGELPATPQEVWDAFTLHTAGWIWETEYEPWVGGAARGMGDGTVTVWDPTQHFAQRSPDGDGFNQLDFELEPRGAGTHLSYRHRGVIAEDYDRQLDACRQHTAFYNHSLGEYVRHFAGRDAVYVSAEASEASAKGGFAAMRKAMGVPDEVAVGDPVRLTPAGLEPIEGVVDYATPAFLGVRGADALYRFYGRDVWGWPVGVAHHLFADGADKTASEQAWSRWLDGVFATEAVK